MYRQKPVVTGLFKAAHWRTRLNGAGHRKRCQMIGPANRLVKRTSRRPWSAPGSGFFYSLVREKYGSLVNAKCIP